MVVHTFTHKHASEIYNEGKLCTEKNPPERISGVYI